MTKLMDVQSGCRQPMQESTVMGHLIKTETTRINVASLIAGVSHSRTPDPCGDLVIAGLCIDARVSPVNGTAGRLILEEAFDA